MEKRKINLKFVFEKPYHYGVGLLTAIGFLVCVIGGAIDSTIDWGIPFLVFIVAGCITSAVILFIDKVFNKELDKETTTKE